MRRDEEGRPGNQGEEPCFKDSILGLPLNSNIQHLERELLIFKMFNARHGRECLHTPASIQEPEAGGSL